MKHIKVDSKAQEKKEYTEKTKREYIGIVKFVEMDFGR